MADSFDPYYTWLGIPPEEQPADHYRLLGVRRFESNTEVIVNAADQRMVYVRTFQTGKRMKESQRLLNEISAAQLCLVDPAKKKAYDEQLQQKLAGGNGGQTAAASVPLQPAAAAPAGGNGTQSQAAAKSGIRSATPLRTATPLTAHATPQAPLRPVQVAAGPTPLQPVVVSLPGAHASAAQVQPVPVQVDPLQGFPAVGPKPSKSIENPAAGLTMSLAIMIGGGSFLTGALVLVGVIIWAATRPAPAPVIVKSPNPVQRAPNEPQPDRVTPVSPSPTESAQDSTSQGSSSRKEETPAPMPATSSVTQTTPPAPAPMEPTSASSSSSDPPTPVSTTTGNGPLIRIVPAIAETGRKLSFSGSGKLLAACDSNNNRCNLILLAANKSMSNHARALVFSPDETKFAVLWPDHTDLFQTDSLGRVAQVHGKPAHVAAFSGDGRLLAFAAPGERVVSVYDVERGTMLDPITTNLLQVAWLGTYEDTLVCWSPEQRAEVINLRNPTERRKLDEKVEFAPLTVTKTGQSPCFYVPSRISDQRISIYRRCLQPGLDAEMHYEKVAKPEQVLAMSRDGLLLALDREGGLDIVRTYGSELLTRIEFPGGQLHAAALTGEEGLLAFNGPGNSALIADMRALLAQPRWQVLLRNGAPILEPVGSSSPPATSASIPSSSNSPSPSPTPTPAPVPVDEAAGRDAIAKLRAAGLQLPDDPQAVTSLRIHVAQLDSQLAPLLAQFPRLESLEFIEIGNAAEVLSKTPSLPSVQNIQLERLSLMDDDLKLLARFPSLRNLSLWGTPIRGEGLSHLQGLWKLEQLNLSEELSRDVIPEICKLKQLKYIPNWPKDTTDADLQQIATMENLTSLQLPNVKLNGSGLVHLAKMPKLIFLQLPTGLPSGALAHLADLKLSHFNFPPDTPDEELIHLAKNANLHGVMAPPEMTDEGVKILAQYPALIGLNLMQCKRITDDGLSHLAANQTIRQLALPAEISDRGLAHLGSMQQLENLSINPAAAITDRGIESLQNLPKLRHLQLGERITDATAASLSRFPALASIDLNKCRFTSKGFRALQGVTKLQHLNMTGMSLTDEDVSALAEIKQLRHLIVNNHKLTPVQMETLKKALPDCNVLNININS